VKKKAEAARIPGSVFVSAAELRYICPEKTTNAD